MAGRPAHAGTILPDGKTQAYSSVLYEGPTLIAVFNGLYTNAPDHASNDATKARVASFLARERQAASAPHVLPFKHAGSWRGPAHAYATRRKAIGSVEARIGYRPLTLLRAASTSRSTGAIERRFRYERSRRANRHTFDGPDVWGNAIGYGRALYTTQHLTVAPKRSAAASSSSTTPTP